MLEQDVAGHNVVAVESEGEGLLIINAVNGYRDLEKHREKGICLGTQEYQVTAPV
tara:strand:- start:1768 stop:1932 length:165 start_codon:yes stop_codon:yes gene_type:complete